MTRKWLWILGILTPSEGVSGSQEGLEKGGVNRMVHLIFK
jgi:hypothetical protein